MSTLSDKSKAEKELEWGIAQLRHLHATGSSSPQAIGRVIASLELGQTGLLAEIRRLAALAVPPVLTAGWQPPTDAQIDSTAEDIASDTSCCDISSSSSWAIGNHIRKLLGLPEEAA